MNFRDSLPARRISLVLIFTLLFELVAPAFAVPWWERKPDYPQARNPKARRSLRHHPKDARLAQVLKNVTNPVSKIPAFHGERPLDGLGDYESGHSPSAPNSLTLIPSSPTSQATPGEAGETLHATPSPSALTAEEPIQASFKEDCGCGNPASGESGAELGYVDADPRKPFPQWEYSRQTFANGPYLPTGLEIPAVHVQDHLLHIARTLDNPGENEEYTLDIVSPKAENNGTERDSTASVRWTYRRLSGTSASSFDAKYMLEIRCWDRHSPMGRVAFRTQEAMWLSQIPLHAGFGLKDLGEHHLITTHNNETPKTQVIQVNYPSPEEDGITRRLSNMDRPADGSPLIAYVTDERLDDTKTFTVPAPDENGQQDFIAQLDWRKSGLNKTRLKSYATMQLHYTSDGDHYRLERRIFDSIFRDGHTVSVEQGEGRLEQVRLTGGASLPQSGGWQLREKADGQPTHSTAVQVRSLTVEVGTLTSSLFQDNGGIVYRMAILSDSQWAPEHFRWLLTLRNKETGATVRTYEGDEEGNTDTRKEFFQIWDGKDRDGNRVANDTTIVPSLSIIVINEPTSGLVASKSTPLAAANADNCDCGLPEEWVLSGFNGSTFRIDDDFKVYINGVLIHTDSTGVAEYNDPLPFQAKAHDSLRIEAKDTFGICSQVEPLYIRRSSTGTRLRLTPGYNGPCDDSAFQLVFFDETYILTDDPKTVEAIFKDQGADLENETRNACEAMAWTRTASVPPPPPGKSLRGGPSASGSQGPPPYSQSAGTGYIGAINNSFNIPGQYTAANNPGVSSIAGDIHALNYNFNNGISSSWFGPMPQSWWSSPIPTAINNGSGRYTHAFSDLVVYSRTAPLYLGRTHASERQGNPDHFGWSWSFDEKLILLQNQAIYTLPDGSAVTYIDDGNGYKPAMSHITTQLIREDERTFRFEYKGGGSSTFKIPDGLTPNPQRPVLAVLRKSTDTNGFSNTFIWDRTGERLLKMQGPDPSQFIKLQWTDDCHPPRLVSARDSHGRTVCYDYKAFTSPHGDKDYLLSKVTLTGDRSISFRYHPVLGRRRYELLDVSHNGVLQKKIVANALSQGQLLEVTHRPDKTMAYHREVDPDSGIATSTLTRSSASGNSPLGESQRVRYQVDFKDRVVQAEDNLGQRAHYEWDDATYNLARAFDDQGREARYGYDERRNLISVQDQLGRIHTVDWDAQDNPIVSTDALGRRSTATFDAHRRPLTATDPLHHTTRMTWSGDGLLTAITNNLGNAVRMEYDTKGLLKTIILPATAHHGPARLSVKRDKNDEVISSTDALGRVYECERDELGRVIKATSPAVRARYRQECLPPAQTRAKFNRNDLLESLTMADGRVTSYRYDLAERLIEVQETGYPAPTRLVYDSFDNVISIIRPNGATTVYRYDRLNRPVLVQYPGGDQESLVYDLRGRVSEWHRGSLVVFYEYDSVDRVKRMYCPATGDDYHYTLDDADRLLTLEDQTGTTTYEYTDNDLLQRITHPGNKSLTYGYDAGDRLISTLDPESVLTEYRYNERNQLVQASHDNQSVFYSYDLLGRATGIQLPNGVQGRQVFDERDRLLFRDYRRGCSPLVTLKYAYNQLGQRILDDRSMPNGNQLARFTYNQRMELVKSVRDRGGCGPDEVHTYAYDLNHNWTKKDGVSYTNNIADQLLAVAGGGSLSYNDSGQATDVQGWDVTYNCADQITGILAPGKNIAYRYDGAGQRVEKTVNGVSQKFLWNGGDICKEYRADGSVRADYFLGAGREGIKTNGQWHWYLSDIQGSTLMLTDASGHSAATYDYSDYGETRQTSGSTALYNPFLYTGQEYDFETSLYHLRARHYSPANGRFFSRDPIGYAGGSNVYAYCMADPVNFIDPSGLDTWSRAYDLLNRNGFGDTVTGIQRIPSSQIHIKELPSRIEGGKTVQPNAQTYAGQAMNLHSGLFDPLSVPRQFEGDVDFYLAAQLAAVLIHEKIHYYLNQENSRHEESACYNLQLAFFSKLLSPDNKSPLSNYRRGIVEHLKAEVLAGMRHAVPRVAP